MKILLVGFKLSIGNELYMNTLYKHLKENGIEVDVCSDSNYVNKYKVGKAIAKGGNAKQMAVDTINFFNWIKFYSLLRKNKYNKIFFISSHSLNNIAILIAKLFKIETISHIHDPIPHSGTNYGWIILLSQKIQSKLSNKIIVYGNKLKDIVIKKYKILDSKVFIIKHGVYRENRDTIKIPENKKYISLLGRIDEYKGIDIFLKAIKELDNQIDKNIKFIIGGNGDLNPYKKEINELKHRLIVKNYLLSNEEFDNILLSSYCLVLPYKDGTQTGNVQVAYYNACPVIVTNVGSIPEIVLENQTGYIIKPNSEKELSNAILRLLSNDYKKLSLNSFNYYKNNLRWDKIIINLIKIIKRDCL